MKTNWFRQMCRVAIPIILTGLLAACGSVNQTTTVLTTTNTTKTAATTATTESQTEATTVETTKQLDEATLYFMFFALEPNKIADVVDEFEKRTKDTLNIKFEYEFVPFEDYPNKVKLKLSAAEPIDSLFDAPWWMMNDMIAKGNYVALDQYFYNDAYPGLKQAFPSDYLENNRFLGKIYGIPFTQGFVQSGLNGFSYRTDLREKYSMPEIETTEQFIQYLDKVIENEKGIIPIVAQGAYRFDRSMFYEKNIVQANKNNIFTITISQEFETQILLSSDGKQLVSVNFIGDPANLYDGYPEPFKTDLTTYADLVYARDWYTKGYFEKDIINQKDPDALVNGGKAAAMCGMVSKPGWEVFSPITSTQKQIPKAWATDYKAWNFQCIPVTSKNVERTMMFYNWLFSSRENHDLFEYGIKGTDWDQVGDDQYKLLPEGTDPTKSYNMYGFQLSWNPMWIRYQVGMNPKLLTYTKYCNSLDSTYLSPLAGFSFNPENVKTEIAKVAPILGTDLQPLRWGMLEDISGEIKKAYDKAGKLGLETIRAEIKKQLEAFLAK